MLGVLQDGCGGDVGRLEVVAGRLYAEPPGPGLVLVQRLHAAIDPPVEEQLSPPALGLHGGGLRRI